MQSFWDVIVPSYREGSTSMGPLTYGTRTHHDDPKSKDSYEMLDSPMKELSIDAHNIDYHSAVPLQTGNASHVNAAITLHNSRVAAAERIYTAVKTLQTGDPVLKPTHTSIETSTYIEDVLDLEPEEEIQAEQYLCPKWDEMCKHLFRNRHPLRLALDTMNIMSESTLYRYYRDLEAIFKVELSPMEFRHFLGVANERRELFLYKPFPGAGTVTRIEAGWPVPLPYQIPKPRVPPPEAEVMMLLTTMRLDSVKDFFYKLQGETRDLDIDMFFIAMNKYTVDYEFVGERFNDIVLECVDRDNPHFILGPKGIIRFTYEITDDLRNKYKDDSLISRQRMVETEKIAREALEAWKIKMQVRGIERRASQMDERQNMNFSLTL